MRTPPPALLAAVEAGAATLCTAWIVIRADGARLGFTDHDRPLAVEGVLCEAASGWTAGAADGELGFAPGQASASGALSSDALTDADIAAGLYDGAVVETWRVDWSAPDARMRLRRETVRRLVRTGEGFTAELEGPLAALRKVVGRAYDRVCDAQLGDARCRVDLRAFPGATCDKAVSTCRDVFSNAVNFQGFPDTPGDDFLAVYAATAGAADGGSRR